VQGPRYDFSPLKRRGGVVYRGARQASGKTRERRNEEQTRLNIEGVCLAGGKKEPPASLPPRRLGYDAIRMKHRKHRSRMPTPETQKQRTGTFVQGMQERWGDLRFRKSSEEEKRGKVLEPRLLKDREHSPVLLGGRRAPVGQKGNKKKKKKCFLKE